MVNKNDLYNEDELNAPEWMNKEFFAKVLTNKENGCNVEIESFVITPGTTKSDHYASIIFRAKVNYSFVDGNSEEPKCQSLIIKAMPVQEGEKKELLGNMQLFETEIGMYTETLPNIEAALSESGDDSKLCARVLYHSLEPQKCIVFEDLVAQGYAVISNRWCTIEEVRAALFKVAKLHAVSYKLAQEGDSKIPSYQNGSFSNTHLLEMDCFKNGVKLFKEILSEHNDLTEYIPHIETIEDDIVSKCISLFNAYNSRTEPRGFFVLNHGDFHMKNMMFKHSAGELQDLLLVDYQISCFASPAIDVFYSFIMLMSPDMRRDHREELFYFYFSNFQQTLRQIEYAGRIPTMTDFHVELLKHKHWELYLFMTFLQFNYVFSSAEGDLAKAVENEKYRRKLLQNPEMVREIRNFLPFYLNRGYFEN